MTSKEELPADAVQQQPKEKEPIIQTSIIDVLNQILERLDRIDDSTRTMANK